MLQPLRGSSLVAVALLLAACGGIVLVDQDGSGGAGGAPTTSTSPSSSSSSSSISSSSSGTPTTSVTSSVSSGTSTGFCDGSGDCGFATPSPDCLFCDASGCIGCAVAGACADELAACQSEPQCVSFVTCVDGCASQQCVDECVNQSPQGGDLYNLLAFCVICDECPIDCDGPGSGCP